MFRRAIALTLLVALPALTGCYEYVPAARQGLELGTSLRATLVAPMSFDLQDLTAHNIDRVDGEFVQADSSQLTVSAFWLDATTGSGFDANGWTVEIPQNALASLQVKRLDQWRTVAVMAAVVAATYLGFNAFNRNSSGTGSGGTGGNTR